MIQQIRNLYTHLYRQDTHATPLDPYSEKDSDDTSVDMNIQESLMVYTFSDPYSIGRSKSTGGLETLIGFYILQWLDFRSPVDRKLSHLNINIRGCFPDLISKWECWYSAYKSRKRWTFWSKYIFGFSSILFGFGYLLNSSTLTSIGKIGTSMMLCELIWLYLSIPKWISTESERLKLLLDAYSKNISTDISKNISTDISKNISTDISKNISKDNTIE